ncbi:peptidase M24 [Flexistipes sinusarabici DSM 4947]|uniref:Peptidase M24 n=1 Tax=Flexistipes sinusarabici (strain ATCC 49648 / DSM 4947 / MAS 10) TaxID=717231 RepID=F8E3V9_FLESM|nr:Xaa-Pro peptidase family protein [Flexistipes sinusarabici]AEI15461.1 peptidase M24 [Flexistipes sinusarabici DSM 4947]
MNRLEKFQAELSARGMECYIVTDNSHVYYLSGFTGTAGYIVFDNGTFIFVTDGRYENQVKNEISGDFKTEIVTSYINYFKDLAERKKKIAVDANCTLDLYLTLSDETTVNVDRDDIISSMRLIKDENEIELIRQSYKIAGDAFLGMLENVEYNITESVWAATLEYNMKIRGADSLSFDTMVASGDRSALPHGRASEKTVKKGEPVMVDYGCKKYYCSDITRIIYDADNSAVNELIDIVYSALQKAVEVVKPGILCSDVDKTAREYISDKGYGKYFNHGLGHGVGIDVHESPAFRKDNNTKLKPGMVLTVEPGIYLPDNFGIRLEDTVLVNETGCEILSGVLDKYVYKIIN